MTRLHSPHGLISTAAAAMAAADHGAAQAPTGSPKPHSGAGRVQVPGVHRWAVGAITVTAIADGYAKMPLSTVSEATPEAADALAQTAFVTPGDLQCIVNTFAIRTPSKLVMVDTGFGSGGEGHSGKIWPNLAAAGIDPAAVDALVITHGHPDHTSGMLEAEGTAAFPRAELFVHAAEAAYWGDDAAMARAPELQQAWFPAFRKALAAYKGRTTLFDRNDQEIVPGVRVRELFGHTPGHSGLHLSDGEAQHLLWTDIVHFQHLQFPRPDWGVGFDVDPGRAVATRKAMFDMAAADRVSISGSHLVFPAYGHVRRDRHGAYAFEPARWAYDL